MQLRQKDNISSTFPEVFTPFHRLKKRMITTTKRQRESCQRGKPRSWIPRLSCRCRTPRLHTRYTETKRSHWGGKGFYISHPVGRRSGWCTAVVAALLTSLAVNETCFVKSCVVLLSTMPLCSHQPISVCLALYCHKNSTLFSFPGSVQGFWK